MINAINAKHPKISSDTGAGFDRRCAKFWQDESIDVIAVSA